MDSSIHFLRVRLDSEARQCIATIVVQDTGVHVCLWRKRYRRQLSILYQEYSTSFRPEFERYHVAHAAYTSTCHRRSNIQSCCFAVVSD